LNKIKIELDAKSNNLDFLRFWAATLVLVSHSYPLFGKQPEPIAKFLGVSTGGGLAVAAFFVISGFLVTKSYLSRGNPIEFITNRCLRLFPALLVVVFLSVVFLGPAYSSLGFVEYFTDSSTSNYIRTSWLKIQYRLPGVFEMNPRHAVNGSLWTLPVEVLMYFGVLLLGLLGMLKRFEVLLIVACLLVLHFFLMDYYNLSKIVWLGIIPLSNAVKLGVFFFSGGLYYLFKDKIPMTVFGVLVAILAILFLGKTEYGQLVYLLAFPYFVLGLGYMKAPLLPKFGRYGDFSYGIYLFAFPIQQAIYASFGNILGFYELMLLSFLLTLFASVISWHVVEKPALAYKKAVACFIQNSVHLLARTFSNAVTRG